MPSTFPESPGLGYGALWHLEMLCAAFWDSEGNVGSQGRDSAPQGGGDVSGRLRSGSGGSWRAFQKVLLDEFRSGGDGGEKGQALQAGEAPRAGKPRKHPLVPPCLTMLRAGPWSSCSAPPPPRASREHVVGWERSRDTSVTSSLDPPRLCPRLKFGVEFPLLDVSVEFPRERWLREGGWPSPQSSEVPHPPLPAPPLYYLFNYPPAASWNGFWEHSRCPSVLSPSPFPWERLPSESRP